MPESSPRGNKALFTKVAVSAGVLLIVVALLQLGFDVKGLVLQGIGWGIDLLRRAGPAAFFTAMALAPGLGVPLLAFALTAGPAFSERFGMPTTVALALVAVTVNMVLTYWLARRALRPALAALVARLGYQLPEVESGDATDLVVILRMTPGIPFFVQNYLCGLADVPFGRYLVISCLASWAQNAGFVVFGDALLHGRGRVALAALGVLAAVAAITHFVRRHYGRRKKVQP